MPIISIDVLEGYDAATKARLGRAVTNAVRGVVAAPADAVTVILRDVPADNYLRGGIPRSPGPPLPEPDGVVRRFLAAMESRDLDTARGLLAPGFAMTFPGGARLATLEELIAWATPRYRFVRKTYERFDSLPGPDGATVYCFGTLSGEWPDGRAFAGIRFIDRFEIVDGRIARQQVWNDIAETQRAETRAEPPRAAPQEQA